MIHLEPLRARWLAERDTYDALASYIRDHLQAETRKRGLLSECSARAKDVASLLKKAWRKGYKSPYEDIHDKAGARVIVTYPDEVQAVEEIVRGQYQVHHHENKTLGLPPNQLGYLGVHFEVSLHDGSVPVGKEEWRGLVCEVQVHTRAQSLWATVSHHLLYKAEPDRPDELKRRIFRLVALIELFDEEVRSAKRDIMALPGLSESQLLDRLERSFYRLAAREFDRELSLDILGKLVKGLYSAEERTHFPELMDGFVREHEDKLSEIFERYREDDRCSPLLFQPESLLIFERLEHDPFRLRDTWERMFPLELLRELSVVWGTSV